jgi:capsular polysaccharide biosynthesis protein
MHQAAPPPQGIDSSPVSYTEIAATGRSAARIIRDNVTLIIAITLITAGVAWILAALQPDQYRASALAAVAPLAASLEANEVLRGVEVLERRTVVATIAALASTESTRTQAAAGKDYDIEAAVLPNTNLFRVDVTGANAEQTAAIANRIPDLLSKQTQALYKFYGVMVVSPAARPTEPFLPRTGRAISTGLVIGLFLGFLAAILKEKMRAGRGTAA